MTKAEKEVIALSRTFNRMVEVTSKRISKYRRTKADQDHKDAWAACHKREEVRERLLDAIEKLGVK